MFDNNSIYIQALHASIKKVNFVRCEIPSFEMIDKLVNIMRIFPKQATALQSICQKTVLVFEQS